MYFPIKHLQIVLSNRSTVFSSQYKNSGYSTMAIDLVFKEHFMAWQPPGGPGPPHCWGLEITLRHTTLGRTSLDKWLARRRNLYLTIHNTHKRQISMPLAGVKARDRPCKIRTNKIYCNMLLASVDGFGGLVGEIFRRIRKFAKSDY
jgi:hypothetical protein